VTFPEEYGAKHLAGKEAAFDVHREGREGAEARRDRRRARQALRRREPRRAEGPDRERLEAEYAGAARQVMKRALLDQLDTMVSFDLPPSLVKAEATRSRTSSGTRSIPTTTATTTPISSRPRST
jgi:trigger factor